MTVEVSDSRLHRAGAVALLGPPNAGKSSLLNALLGQKLAIVTAKPQTTRSRILGIHNIPGAQLLFFDTPGRHEGKRPLNTALNESVSDVLEKCDVGVLVVDRTRGWERVHEELERALIAEGKPYLVLGTKRDRSPSKGSPWPPPIATEGVQILEASAKDRRGLDEFAAAVALLLPISPPLYPEDALTDKPLRWLAAEFIREAVFEVLDQELPYTTAVEVVEFDERSPDLVRIRANLLVARESQKRIVVGNSGKVVKAIGIRARSDIERLLDTQVHLALWVKIEPRWLSNPQRLKALGYA